MIRFVAPGPLVPIATADRPVILVAPSAAKPAACSWRILMIGVFANRAIASVRNAIIPPESSKIAGA